MTEQELKVLKLLGQAFNFFVELEVMHQSDQHEFAQAIHVAQNIVLAREGIRSMRDSGVEVA